MTEKKIIPGIALWPSRDKSKLQIYLNTPEKVERAQRDLRALADSLEVGSYLMVSNNPFRDKDQDPTHRFKKYKPNEETNSDTSLAI